MAAATSFLLTDLIFENPDAAPNASSLLLFVSLAITRNMRPSLQEAVSQNQPRGILKVLFQTNPTWSLASQSDALQRRRHLPWRIHSWRWTEMKSLSFPLPSYFCTFKNMSPHSLCSCSETTHPTSSSMNTFPFWSGSNKPLQKKGSLPCLGCLLVHNRVQGWQTIPHGPNPAQYQFCV